MSLIPSDDDEDAAIPQLGVHTPTASSERYADDGLAGADLGRKHASSRSGRSRSGTSFSDGLDSPMQLGDVLMLSDDELHLGGACAELHGLVYTVHMGMFSATSRFLIHCSSSHTGIS